MNTDLDDEIEIVEDGLTLDGNGHTLTGINQVGVPPPGLYLNGRTGVTIQNLNVQNLYQGIRLEDSDDNILTDITASNNYMGIVLVYSSDNAVTGNAASNNNFGIMLAYSDNNNVTGNTATNNGEGIRLYYSSCNNTLTNNSFSDNGTGIWVTDGSNDNTLTGNTVINSHSKGIFIQISSNNFVAGNTASNNDRGVELHLSYDNTLTGNTFAWNYRYGVHLSASHNTQIYNNNFVSNAVQAHVTGGSNNVFNLDEQTGGNHWSDWTRPDKNGDGIVDSPYVFFGGQDDLPWSAPNGWDLFIAREMLELLTEQVAALNLPKGFVGKLNDAAKVLSDANPNNNKAAGNKLNDFIDQVNGKADKISDAGGNPYALIDAAEAIIAMIEAG